MRIVTAGGALLAVPHVAGFAVRPTTKLGIESWALPQPSACCRLRHQSTLRTTHRRTDSVLSARQSSWSRYIQGCTGGKGGSRRRPWWATGSASATSTSAVMTSSPPEGATSDGRQLNGGTATTEGERGGLGLRLAIVGTRADELGLRIAQRYGFGVKSMDELMKGRKGPRTDTVKAKAVSQWMADEKGADGGILTGFPTTAAQAESLEKQGVDFDQLVVVDDALEGEPSGSGEEDGPDLLTRYEGKVVKIAGQEGVEQLCDSAARWLAFAHREEHGVGGPAAGAAGLPSLLEGEQAPTDASSSSEEGAEGSSMDAAVAVMSPSERELTQKRDPVAYQAALQASKSGVEAKRAARAAIKQKKRTANEAQQLDTPFYVAVAQGQPKARYRPPVPVIPSRITERLSSSVAAHEEDGETNTRIEFGPLVLDSPASDCLLTAGITEPTGIQQAGMGPILNGESVILHSMTGSGKTLAFLLPLIQRWAPALCSRTTAAASTNGWRGQGVGSDGPNGGFQVVLALPTRELAVQVARETVLLAGGVTASVELLVDSNVFHDLARITAPVVVGSAKVLERSIRKSHPSVRAEVMSRVKCLVVDEVDRLVDVVSKHAPPKEVEKRKRHARPIAALLEKILRAKPDVQIVACSATIGRPLRRELGHIVRRSSALGAIAGGDGGGSSSGGGGDGEEKHGSRELRVIRDPFALSSVDNISTERAVAIPDTIRHYCVPLRDGEFFSRLEALTAAVRELQPRRPLIFVPPEERVTAVVAHLRRAGGDIGRRAVALHEAMGFASDEAAGGVRGLHTSEAIQQHDLLAGQFRGVSNGGPSGMLDGDLLAGSGVGRLGAGEAGAILVTGEDSARGLHFDDVDFVFLMQKPKSPDEYVHLAGRTGRQGKTGSVVNMVPFEEFRKLKAWSSSLKVHFEPLDIMNVLQR